MNSKVATGPALLTSLTNFVNTMLCGEYHREVWPILFGGSLIVFQKKSGGIRTITIGYSLHRIAAN